jgi:HK97 family phage major capsid protein
MTVKLAVPTAPEELQETLLDKGKLKAIIDGDGMPEFMTNYHKAFAKADAGQTEEIAKEQMTRVLAEMLRDNEIDLSGMRKPVGPKDSKMATSMESARKGLHNATAPGAQIDGMFNSPVEFFNAIHHLADRGGENGEQLKKIKNAMSSTIGSDGGFLIPEVLRAELLQVALETAIVRPRARVIPMETLRVGFPSVDATSNVSSVYGGLTGFWTEEGAPLQNVSPVFGRVVLEAKKLTIYTEVPNELQSDSAISFDALISQMFPEALSWYEDVAFVSGTGVGEPLGALSALNLAMIAIAAEGGQTAATLVWENIVKMFSRMLPAALARSVWVASIDSFPQLATMALSVGTGGSAIWLNNGQEGPPMTILGRPVLFTEKTSVLGTQGDLSFVDFGHYLIGDRQAMSAMSSPHFKFGNDVTAYRVIERVDGRPWLQTPITPKNGGPTLSAFVQVATRP